MGLRLLIVLIVLLVGLFAAAVYVGTRPDKPGGTGANKDGGWKVKRFAQSAVPREDIVCSCLKENTLTVQLQCDLTVTEAKSRFGVRTLHLKITRGIVKAKWVPDDADEDNPGKVEMKMDAGDKKKVDFKVPVLRHGGRLTLVNDPPSLTSPATIEVLGE
jgi:hypothetical protein